MRQLKESLFGVLAYFGFVALWYVLLVIGETITAGTGLEPYAVFAALIITGFAAHRIISR